MDYRLLKYFKYGSKILNESISRPRWAACHLFGMFDQKFLLKYHQRIVRDWNDDIHYQATGFEILQNEFASEIKNVQKEYERIRKQWPVNVLSRSIPPGRDASEELQFLLFALVLLLKPTCILEIGVARGSSSRALLSGLEICGRGHLISIDFPFLITNYANEIGMLVSQRLRKKWTLHIGPSQLILPKILTTDTRFQLIIHDGAHSYHVQRNDLQQSLSTLDPDGVIVCDDLNNDSFLEVGQERFKSMWCLKQPKKNEPIGLAWRKQ